MGAFVIRAAVTGFALWVVTHVVHGLSFVGGDTRLQRVGIIFVVAVIFGLVNAFIKPVVQILSIPLYILTLGLFHVVVNALMLWITAWITEHTTHWGLAIDHQFERVVVQPGVREVPVVVVGFVEEIEAVEPLDPAHLDAGVDARRIGTST